MRVSLWIGVVLLAVLTNGCRYTSRQEPSNAATGQGGSTGNEAEVVGPTGGQSREVTSADKPVEVVVEVARMEERSRKGIPPERKQVSTFVSGVGRTTLPVAAERIHYDLQLRLVAGGQVHDWSGDLWCCELRSTDARVPFVWAAWSQERMTNFRAVSSPGPVSYAAWVELTTKLCFEEIVGSREAKAALAPYFSRCARRSESGSLVWERDLTMAAHFSPPGASAVVSLFIDNELGGDEFIGLSGADIRAQSIERDAAGHWTVKVTGPKSDKVYTFVSPDGVNWERK